MPTTKATKSSRTIERGMWSEEEHDKFLVALKVHPKGPWKIIAAQVGTRSSRQVQTHAQKYYEKVARRLRGLRKDRKKLVRPEHRLDDDMMKLCEVSGSDNTAKTSRLGPIRKVRSRSSSSNAKAASPVSVDVVAEDVDPTAEANCFEQPQSFMSLLTEQSEFSMRGGYGDVTDSDDLDSLADVDDYYLDFLIDALDSSDCVSDGSCSE